MLLQMPLFHSFYDRVVFHCICVLQLPYRFTHGRMFRLLPCLGYCKQCCSDYWVQVSFQIEVFSGYMPRSGITGSGLPWWFRHKERACSVGDPDLNPVLGRAPREGNGYPLQYSCLENSTDRGAWWATVHRVTTSCTQLSD